MSRATAAVAAGCAAISAVLMVVMWGLFALIRQYRELTFPAGLLLGCAAVVLGWIAFRGFTRPDASQRPPDWQLGVRDHLGGGFSNFLEGRARRRAQRGGGTNERTAS